MVGSRTGRNDGRAGVTVVPMNRIAADTHPLLAGIENVLALGAPEPGWMTDLRLRAATRFGQLGIPDRAVEAWRFTNLKHLADAPYPAADPGATHPDVRPWTLTDAHSLVFVDGRMRPELSRVGDLPAGATLMGLSEMTTDELVLIEGRFGAAAPIEDQPFAALNTAGFADGAVLRLNPGTVIERPVQVLFVTGDHEHPTSTLPRTLVVAGAGSQATIVESYVGPSSGNAFTCAVTEALLGEGAVVDHYVLTEESDAATHISGFHAHQGRDSVLRSHAFTLSGAVIRHDITTTLAGEGADANLNGLYLTHGRQHVDNQLRVHHTRPHCTSHQLYKGVLDDSSKAIFNGRIVVDPGAQKTDAKQSNRNLLLSDTAQAQSNPQLEIYADDVRCTHGSTIGRLDEEAVFYLRSRGIDRASAENLLTYAFAAEIADGVRIGELRDRLREILFTRLPGSRLVREIS